jgi:hypothetical protein
MFYCCPKPKSFPFKKLFIKIYYVNILKKHCKLTLTQNRCLLGSFLNLKKNQIFIIIDIIFN